MKFVFVFVATFSVLGALVYASVERNVVGFNGITVDGPFIVTVTFSKKEGVTLNGDSRAVAGVETVVDKLKTLNIRLKSGTSRGNLQIAVAVKKLDNFISKGASQVTINSGFKTKNLMVATYGTSKLILQKPVEVEFLSAVVSESSSLQAAVAATSVSIVNSGNSKSTLTGSADNANVVTYDTSRFSGGGLSTTFTSISASGKSNAEVRASKELKVSASDTASVFTSGSAKVKKEVRDQAKVLAG